MSGIDLPGKVVETTISGQQVRFFVNDPDDLIQGHHQRGEFYEEEELALIAGHVTPQTRYLDIGANVGNHIVWLMLYAGLQSAVAVEPNPKAIAILETNLRLNGLLEAVDMSCTGFGLADKPGRAILEVPSHNLGGARFDQTTSEGLPVVTGDELLGNRDFDFVKIDVEGMEISCLTGLDQTIRRCRPTMFIEVDNQNTLAFQLWLNKNGYVVAERYKRYTANENFLIVPVNDNA